VDSLVSAGYGHGVPMGGHVQPRPGATPGFFYWATRDPNGAGLERLQIIKLWADEAGSHERVVDVACGNGTPPRDGRCPSAASQPDQDCVPPPGAGELRGHWRDAEYDPEDPAAYYLRVIQVPTCRWSTYDAQELGIAIPDGLPRTLQERAVTSAIWFTDSAMTD
jgi:hypothetical protein